MFSGEEMKTRLEVIRHELGCAPDLSDMEKPTLTELAMFAGQVDAYACTAYRMVVNLICDIEAEIEKDEKKAEADRMWWEKYKAEELGTQDGKEQEAPDAE